MDEPSDAEIVNRLQAVPPERWSDLWSAVEEMMAEESHSTWVGLTCTYSDEVGRVVDGLYQADLIVPFDWAHWWEGRRRYGDNSAAVEKAPVADAVRMITVVVRQDRFVEGGLGAAIENGVLPAALRRLRRWYDER